VLFAETVQTPNEGVSMQMKYVVPYLRARHMDEGSEDDEMFGREDTTEKLDEIDALFMCLERIKPPPTLVESILTSVKILSHTAPQSLAACGQGAEAGALVAQSDHHPPS
jgi:hypothetical protein